MIENRETIKRLSAKAVGFGASRLFEVNVDEVSSSVMVSGEDSGGSNGRSSLHSKSPTKCTQIKHMHHLRQAREVKLIPNWQVIHLI